MPERARRLARLLNLGLSMAAVVTFSAAPAASAQSTPTSTPKPGTSSGKNTPKPGSSGSKQPDASSDNEQATSCAAKAVPPPANEGNGDQLPPLPLPKTPVGGGALGNCGPVLPKDAPSFPPDGITADSWLIADQDTGDVLAGSAPHARQRPAGTIKVLLALVALKEIDPDKVVVGTKEDTRQTGTRLGIVADGKYAAKDLIRGLIVNPAADAANALARELGGADVAAQKMNDFAASLNALDTRVVNPNGNDVPGQSTSAFDTALIYREAMRIPEFAEATGSKRVQIKPQGARNTAITRTNDNKLLTSFDGATGGKLGSTTAAKSVFVGSAERDGKKLIVSVMRSEQQPFEQAESMLEYGFTLAAARSKPVGKLTGASEPPQTSRSTDTPAKDEEETSKQAASDSVHRSAFGTFGLPVTILAGVIVLIGLAMTAKRKMARARRLRAQGR